MVVAAQSFARNLLIRGLLPLLVFLFSSMVSAGGLQATIDHSIYQDLDWSMVQRGEISSSLYYKLFERQSKVEAMGMRMQVNVADGKILLFSESNPATHFVLDIDPKYTAGAAKALMNKLQAATAKMGPAVVKGLGSSAKSMTVELPVEGLKFLLGMGAVAWLEMAMNPDANPIGLMKSVQDNLSPTGLVGLALFIGTSRFLQVTYENFAQNPTNLSRTMFGFGVAMTGGMLIQHYYSEIVSNPDVRTCFAQMKKKPSDQQFDTTPQPSADDSTEISPCDRAWEVISSSEQLWSLIPSAVSMTIAGGATAVAVHAIKSSFNKAAVETALKEAEGQTLKIAAVEVGLTMIPYFGEARAASWIPRLTKTTFKFVGSKSLAIGRVLGKFLGSAAELGFFVLANDWISPAVTRGSQDLFVGPHYLTVESDLWKNYLLARKDGFNNPDLLENTRKSLVHFRLASENWRSSNNAQFMAHYSQWEESLAQLMNEYAGTFKAYQATNEFVTSLNASKKSQTTATDLGSQTWTFPFYGVHVNEKKYGTSLLDIEGAQIDLVKALAINFLYYIEVGKKDMTKSLLGFWKIPSSTLDARLRLLLFLISEYDNNYTDYFKNGLDQHRIEVAEDLSSMVLWFSKFLNDTKAHSDDPDLQNIYAQAQRLMEFSRPQVIPGKAMMAGNIINKFSASGTSNDEAYLESIPKKKLGPFFNIDKIDYILASIVCGPDVSKKENLVIEDQGILGSGYFKVGWPNKFLAPKLVAKDTTALCALPANGSTVKGGIGARIQSLKNSPALADFMQKRFSYSSFLAVISTTDTDKKDPMAAFDQWWTDNAPNLSQTHVDSPKKFPLGDEYLPSPSQLDFEKSVSYSNAFSFAGKPYTNLANFVVDQFDSKDDFKQWWNQNVEPQMQEHFLVYKKKYAEVLNDYHFPRNKIAESQKVSFPSISTSPVMATYQESLVYLSLLGSLLESISQNQNAPLPTGAYGATTALSLAKEMNYYVGSIDMPVQIRAMDEFKLQWENPVLDVDALLQLYRDNYEITPPGAGQQKDSLLKTSFLPRLKIQSNIVGILKNWMMVGANGVTDGLTTDQEKMQVILNMKQRLQDQAKIFNDNIGVFKSYFGLTNSADIMAALAAPTDAAPSLKLSPQQKIFATALLQGLEESAQQLSQFIQMQLITDFDYIKAL